MSLTIRFVVALLISLAMAPFFVIGFLGCIAYVGLRSGYEALNMLGDWLSKGVN